MGGLTLKFMTQNTGQKLWNLKDGGTRANISWNLYDSYGEALLRNGQRQEAIKMYQKSVELNPDNEGAKKILKQFAN